MIRRVSFGPQLAADKVHILMDSHRPFTLRNSRPLGSLPALRGASCWLSSKQPVASSQRADERAGGRPAFGVASPKD